MFQITNNISFSEFQNVAESNQAVAIWQSQVCGDCDSRFPHALIGTIQGPLSFCDDNGLCYNGNIQLAVYFMPPVYTPKEMAVTGIPWEGSGAYVSALFLNVFVGVLLVEAIRVGVKSAFNALRGGGRME